MLNLKITKFKIVIFICLVLSIILIFENHTKNFHKTSFTNLEKKYDNLNKNLQKLNSEQIERLKEIEKIIAFNDKCENNLILDNSSFVPKIPYFNKKNERKKYVIKNKNIDIIKIIPSIIDRTYNKIKINHSSSSIEKINITGEIKKLTAYDFTVLAKYNDKLCNFDLKLYLTTNSNFKSVTQNIQKIFGRFGYDYGKFVLPYGSFINRKKNTIMISDCTNELVQEFNLDGNSLRLIRSIDFPFNRPADIKVKNDKIYIVEEENHFIRVLDYDGNLIKTIGSFFKFNRLKKARSQYKNFNQPLFNKPLSIAIDNDENIFVSDYDNYRILKISSENKVLKIFGYREMYNGKQIDAPYYLAISNTNQKLYLVDQGNNRILVFNLNGNFIFSFGKKGSKNGEFNNPHEIEIFNDKVYIADTRNSRIQIFDLNGNFIDKIDFLKQLPSPKTVAVHNNKIFVGHASVSNAFISIWNDPSFKKKFSFNNVKMNSFKKNKINFFEKMKTRKNYNNFCSSCHDKGLNNAPRTKYFPDWREKKYNIDQMVSKVKSGNDSMLLNGGCVKCSDQEIKNIINFMLPFNYEN